MQGDAVLESPEIILEESFAVGLRQRNGVRHVGALGVGAEMAIPHGGEADWVEVDVGSPALELLDEVQGCNVDGRASALGVGCGSESRDDEGLEGNHG